MDALKQVTDEIRTFRDERDWLQFHSPKNLAASVMIEAGELMEHFQWCSGEESHAVGQRKRTEVSHEIADVAVYLIELADVLGIDIIDAIREKMRLNEQKYPVSKSRGSAKKYTELGSDPGTKT